jgi:hypothetical protein
MLGGMAPASPWQQCEAYFISIEFSRGIQGFDTIVEWNLRALLENKLVSLVQQ